MDTGQVVFRTYTTLGSAIAALPEPLALGLGNVVGDVLYRVRHEHRIMVKANLPSRPRSGRRRRPTPRSVGPPFLPRLRPLLGGGSTPSRHVARRGRPAHVRRRAPPPPRGVGGRQGHDPGPPPHRQLGVRRRVPGDPGPADDGRGRADRTAGPLRLLRRAARRHGPHHRAARRAVGGHPAVDPAQRRPRRAPVRPGHRGHRHRGRVLRRADDHARRSRPPWPCGPGPRCAREPSTAVPVATIGPWSSPRSTPPDPVRCGPTSSASPRRSPPASRV